MRIGRRVFFWFAAITLAAFSLNAQNLERNSAWWALVERNPEIVDDASVDWRQRLILYALTPRQAEDYFSGRVTAEQLILQDGRTLAAFLEDSESPAGSVYVAIPVACRLFDGRLLDPSGGATRSESVPLQAATGGSRPDCAIASEATAVVLNLRAESAGGVAPRIKMWSKGLPEPAAAALEGGGQSWEQSQSITTIVNLCREPWCGQPGLQMRSSGAAIVFGDIVGYFRPLSAADRPGMGPIFPLAIESDNNNFFGTGAGENNGGIWNSFFGANAGFNNTNGSFNSFFGFEAGFSNIGGAANSFFGVSAGRSNTSGFDNSFFGSTSGFANTTGRQNSFFGGSTGRFNSTGSFNSFFGDGAGAANTTGAHNSFFGKDAGFSNKTADWNSFFGRSAGEANTEGFDNSFFGFAAGESNTTGQGNSFFGSSTGQSNTTGSFNSFFGREAGFSNTATCCSSFFGAFAGRSNTTGVDNAFFGAFAGLNNTGSGNSFFGRSAGLNNSTGRWNSFFGTGAGADNTTGSDNAFFGWRAGRANTTGGSNAFFGHEAGVANTTGRFNSFFGLWAGLNNTTGAANAFFGLGAGFSNTTEDNNTFIGTASTGAAGISNATSLGFRAQVTQSDSLVLGSIAGLNVAPTGEPHASVNVGIGTPAPEHALHVERADGSARVLVRDTDEIPAARTLLALENNGAVRFNLVNTASEDDWFFSQDGLGRFIVSLTGTGGPELMVAQNGTVLMGPGPSAVFALSPDGNLAISGMLLQNSNREAKANFESVDAGEILRKVSELPISRWSFRFEDESVRRLGPMAQDFHAAFGLGDDETKLAPLDASGVALAAIQGLFELAQEQMRENERLHAELERLQGLERRLAALEAALTGAAD